MQTRSSRVLSLAFALVLAPTAWGCGDSDGGHGEDGGAHGGTGGAHGGTGGHGDHTTCGLQENCGRDEELDLADNLIVDGEDGNFRVMFHGFNDLSIDDNEWMIMIMDADGAVAGASVTVSTWSVDCMHPGPTEPEEVTTNDMGMTMVHPVTAHGGPWDVIVEVEADGATDTVTIPLCIPGASHGADAGPQDMHGDDAGTTHDMHTGT